MRVPEFKCDLNAVLMWYHLANVTMTIPLEKVLWTKYGNPLFLQQPSSISDAIGRYFCNVPTELASKLPKADGHFSTYVRRKKLTFRFARVNEIEVNSGKIFTEPRKRRGKYSQSHYSPRLRRIIVLVYTHEVISTKSERKPFKSRIWLTDQITRKFKNRSLQHFQTWQFTRLLISQTTA